MESGLYDIYALVEAYQKTYSFASLTQWFFLDSSQVTNKNRTRCLSIKFYLLFCRSVFLSTHLNYDTVANDTCVLVTY